MIKGITTERTKGNTLESLSISRRKLSFPNNNKFIRIASISEVKGIGMNPNRIEDTFHSKQTGQQIKNI